MLGRPGIFEAPIKGALGLGCQDEPCLPQEYSNAGSVTPKRNILRFGWLVARVMGEGRPRSYRQPLLPMKPPSLLTVGDAPQGDICNRLTWSHSSLEWSSSRIGEINHLVVPPRLRVEFIGPLYGRFLIAPSGVGL